MKKTPSTRLVITNKTAAMRCKLNVTHLIMTILVILVADRVLETLRSDRYKENVSPQQPTEVGISIKRLLSLIIVCKVYRAK